MQEKDSSLDLSKEEFVKSYNLRRNDNIPKMKQEKAPEKSNGKIKRDEKIEEKDGKSENTDVVKKIWNKNLTEGK